MWSADKSKYRGKGVGGTKECSGAGDEARWESARLARTHARTKPRVQSPAPNKLGTVLVLVTFLPL